MIGVTNRVVRNIRSLKDDLFTEVVTPRDFLRLLVEEGDSIESSEIIPPTPGKDFGKIRVVRKYPVVRPPRRTKSSS